MGAPPTNPATVTHDCPSMTVFYPAYNCNLQQFAQITAEQDRYHDANARGPRAARKTSKAKDTPQMIMPLIPGN